MTSYKKQRLILIILSLVSITTGITLFLCFFKNHLIYFYGPSELPPVLKSQQIIRIGGLVEEHSLLYNHDFDHETVTFWITDYQARIKVAYSGLLPDLFREGQGVVAEGYMDRDGIFHAHQVLAKHDENYRPPELQRSIDKATKTNLNKSLRQS